MNICGYCEQSFSGDGINGGVYCSHKCAGIDCDKHCYHFVRQNMIAGVIGILAGGIALIIVCILGC